MGGQDIGNAGEAIFAYAIDRCIGYRIHHDIDGVGITAGPSDLMNDLMGIHTGHVGVETSCGIVHHAGSGPSPSFMRGDEVDNGIVAAAQSAHAIDGRVVLIHDLHLESCSIRAISARFIEDRVIPRGRCGKVDRAGARIDRKASCSLGEGPSSVSCDGRRRIAVHRAVTGGIVVKRGVADRVAQDAFGDRILGSALSGDHELHVEDPAVGVRIGHRVAHRSISVPEIPGIRDDGVIADIRTVLKVHQCSLTDGIVGSDGETSVHGAHRLNADVIDPEFIAASRTAHIVTGPF